MKIITLVGTRPELIRLSLIIRKLDYLVNHVFVYTNQNFDYNLSGKFFNELSIREPDYYFDKNWDSTGSFLSTAFLKFDSVLQKEGPDRLLLLGDTNSGLLSILARKHGVPVYHMEAGNRCYDDSVPEELNRRIIDNLSTFNLPYTTNSCHNLFREGFDRKHVYKTGNPIFEVLKHYESSINDSKILTKMNLVSKEFVVVTSHRAENVDNTTTLINIMMALNKISTEYPVIFPMHPRTKSKLNKININLHKDFIITSPLGFFDFVHLEKNALCVITDSGTGCEEGCIFGVPTIIIRNSTERQETVECGASTIVGTEPEDILRAVDVVMQKTHTWKVPDDYTVYNVSDTVINVLLGKGK